MEASRVNDFRFWEEETPRLAEPGHESLAAWARNCPELGGHVLFATSGSTGTPKWVALSRRALRASAETVNRHLDVSAADGWGLALPERHVGGFGVLARAFFSGTRCAAFAERWHAERFRAWLDRERVTLTTLVPTQVADLVASQLRAPRALRAVVVGGGALEESLGQAARDLGWPVLPSFGMTETGSQFATAALAALERPFAPFPLPLLPGWRVRIEEERLAVSGPALFSGYVVAGKNGWRFLRREGDWFVAADRVRLEPEGLVPLGRSDRRVKVLGELVDLDAIERALAERASAAVTAWKVIDLPEVRRGARLVLAMESEDRALLAAAADYQRCVSGPERLAGWVRVESFPRSELGKIRLGELRDLAAAAAIEDCD